MIGGGTGEQKKEQVGGGVCRAGDGISGRYVSLDEIQHGNGVLEFLKNKTGWPSILVVRKALCSLRGRHMNMDLWAYGLEKVSKIRQNSSGAWR